MGLAQACTHGAADAGNWNCSPRLDEQFRFESPVSAIKITQSDAGTLHLLGKDAAGKIVSKRFRQADGDFFCVDGGLTFLSRGSLFSDENRPESGAESVLATAGGLMVLRGGMRTLEKTLYLSDDGSLIMKLAVTNTGLIFPFPFRASVSAWLRWPAAGSDTGESADE